MEDLNLSALTAMISPAVLISGAGTLLLSTSNRLARTHDRVRQFTARFKILVSESGQQDPLVGEEKHMIIRQLPRLARRSRIIQRAMAALYLTVALLVLASIAIGATVLFGVALGLAPVILAMLGVTALACAAVLLISETLLSSRTTHEEMQFLVRLGQHYTAYDKE